MTVRSSWVTSLSLARTVSRILARVVRTYAARFNRDSRSSGEGGLAVAAELDVAGADAAAVAEGFGCGSADADAADSATARASGRVNLDRIGRARYASRAGLSRNARPARISTETVIFQVPPREVIHGDVA